MGRHKTLSDEQLLAVARRAFREGGFAVPGREVARRAGVSEAVLYQRFGSKDALFLAAMAPTAPDIRKILGPRDPEGDPRAFLRGAVERIAAWFEELLPIAVQTMLHPASGAAGASGPGVSSIADLVKDELAARLGVLQKRGEITGASRQVVARLLIGMAHDWALHRVVLAPGPGEARPPLGAMVDLAWSGLAPAAPPEAAARRRPGPAGARPRPRAAAKHGA